MPRRMIETNVTDEDKKIEGSLRPQTLDDYIGQTKIKENLKVYIEAAKNRGDASSQYSGRCVGAFDTGDSESVKTGRDLYYLRYHR